MINHCWTELWPECSRFFPLSSLTSAIWPYPCHRDHCTLKAVWQNLFLFAYIPPSFRIYCLFHFLLQFFTIRVQEGWKRNNTSPHSTSFMSFHTGPLMNHKSHSLPFCSETFLSLIIFLRVPHTFSFLSFVFFFSLSLSFSFLVVVCFSLFSLFSFFFCFFFTGLFSKPSS